MKSIIKTLTLGLVLLMPLFALADDIQTSLNKFNGILGAVVSILIIICIICFIGSLAAAGFLLYRKKQPGSNIGTGHVMVAIAASALFMVGALGSGAVSYFGTSMGIQNADSNAKQISFKYQNN
ncbi:MULTISPECIES: hypothetical protein [Cysteiniphilum]|uniref:Uncharacterized protein n=1 Tax=Cysteiniphilum litorale TaxID=2056700 RepID=A0A8J2Z341_9GAMM|nr:MULTISPECIES: hypothetical protein [Cysteiniphilum]GGF91717.1 hypothetical protein GCM10010995_06140 [Cysteiniphilum litorale]